MRTIAEGETLVQKMKVFKKPSEILPLKLLPVIEDSSSQLVLNTE